MLQNIHGKSQKEDIDIYDSKLYSNFKELYEDLRMSTINCLTNRTKINSKIKMLSLNHPLFMKLAASVILPDMYEIALHDANYDVRNFSRINNKLRVLSIDSNLRKFLFDLERRAEKDESDSKKLTNLLYELLTKDKLIEKLRKILDRTPLLKHRSSIIKHSLSCFEKQDYLIFCNLIAIQIEGIFYDYLVALGINPGNEKLTLIPKVEKLENADTLEEWAYFKFRFPLIRNAVAHGFLDEKHRLSYFNLDIFGVATELLLDLFDVCKRIAKHNFPANYVINITSKKISFLSPHDVVRLITLCEMNFDFQSIEISRQDIENFIVQYKPSSKDIGECLEEVLSENESHSSFIFLLKIVVKSMERINLIDRQNAKPILAKISSLPIPKMKLSQLNLPEVWEWLNVVPGGS
jgi:hypothetical protein